MLDVRQALRGMRRRRGLTLAAALTLGLGIGAAATMYGVVDEVLLRPLPVRDESRVVVAWGSFQASSFGHVPLSYRHLATIRERSRVFEQLAAVDYNGAWPMFGRAGREAIPLRLGVVTGDLFETLGVSTILGRALGGEDDRVGAAPVAVISEGLWQRRFGSSPAVLGKALPIWTTTYTIVGVMPGDFGLPAGAEAWVTLGAIRPAALTDPEYGTLDLLGRLRPGYTPSDAKAELDRLLIETSPGKWASDSRLGAVVHSLRDVLVGQVKPALVVLWSAAVLVFLVAVLNLGSLLAVQSEERQPEFVLRRALGATRLALMRQLALETGMLVACGGLIGIGLAWVALHVIPAVAPADLPGIGRIALRPAVIAASLALGVVATGIASILPALSMTDSHLNRPRGAAGSLLERPSRLRARTVAVATQVSFAILTVTAALLLVRTLASLQRLEPGFDAASLAVVPVAFLSPRIETDEQALGVMEGIVGRVKELPGVESVAAVQSAPFAGTAGYDIAFVAEGQTESEAASNPYLNYEVVTPDYFATLRTPILRGRSLSDADRKGTLPVAVVSQGLADRMWPGQDPVGKRIRWPDSASADRWLTVVGIASDTRYREFREPRPNIYVPVGQQGGVPQVLVVRSRVALASLLPALRREVRAVDADLDVVDASSMAALLARPLAQPRFNAGVLLAFAIVSVLLAAIGLYGLVSFAVTQRAREIGIRLAVGAQRAQIVTLFLRRGLAPLLAGCVIGVIAVLAGGRVLSSVLYGVTARDPVAIVGAVAGFALVATAAILIPLRRAAETDPSSALRLE